MIAAALTLVGCKQTGKLLNDEEIDRFREEGVAAGGGLKVPELPKLPELPRKKEGGAEGQGGGGAGDLDVVSEVVGQRARCRMQADCLEKTRLALQALRARAAGPLIQIAERDRGLDERVEAIRALGWLGLTEGAKALAGLVTHHNPLIARESAWALGQLRVQEAAAALAPALRHGPKEVREAAAEALGTLATPDAVLALVDAYKVSDNSLRASILSALGRTGHADARPTLEAAARDKDPLIRAEAQAALNRLAIPPAAGSPPVFPQAADERL